MERASALVLIGHRLDHDELERGLRLATAAAEAEEEAQAEAREQQGRARQDGVEEQVCKVCGPAEEEEEEEKEPKKER